MAMGERPNRVMEAKAIGDGRSAAGSRCEL